MNALVFNFLVLFGFLAQAQSFQGGAKIGLNFPEKPSIRTENAQLVDIKTQIEDQSNAYHLGLYLKMPFVGAYIRPELNYSHYKIDYIDAFGNSFYTSTNRLDFPILFGFQPVKVFYAHAGVVTQYYFGDETTLSNIQNSEYQDFNFGYQLGAGLSLGKISFEGRFEGAFTERTIDFLATQTSYEIQSNGSQFLLSLGYQF